MENECFKYYTIHFDEKKKQYKSEEKNMRFKNSYSETKQLTVQCRGS
jgi:hypothetical protein